MSTILVSILSKHTLPNYLFAKEIEGQYDDHLFITTSEVDSRFGGEQLEEALQLPLDKADYISVDGNDYNRSLEELKKWEVRSDDKYIVNLTGGTKIMSLAVHDFFASLDAKFHYVPIGLNTYYSFETGESKPINYRVSLKEYFTLYDIHFKSTAEGDFRHSKEEAYRLFDQVRQNRFYLTPRLRNAHNAETPEMRKYLAGEWFEQFSYFKIKDVFDLNETDIALSAKIYRKKDEPANDNELDVAFMYENRLHIVECKVSMTGYGKVVRDTIEEYLYKLAAISKDYGMQVKPYIFTLHKMNGLSTEVRKNLSKRCRILGIEGLVSGNMFIDLKGSLYNKKALLPDFS